MRTRFDWTFRYALLCWLGAVAFGIPLAVSGQGGANSARTRDPSGSGKSQPRPLGENQPETASQPTIQQGKRPWDVPGDNGVWNSVPESEPHGVSIRYTRKQLQLINRNSHRVRVILKMYYEKTLGDQSWDPRDLVEVLGAGEQKNLEPYPDATADYLEIGLVGILIPGSPLRSPQDQEANEEYLRDQSKMICRMLSAAADDALRTDEFRNKQPGFLETANKILDDLATRDELNTFMDRVRVECRKGYSAMGNRYVSFVENWLDSQRPRLANLPDRGTVAADGAGGPSTSPQPSQPIRYGNGGVRVVRFPGQQASQQSQQNNPEPAKPAFDFPLSALANPEATANAMPWNGTTEDFSGRLFDSAGPSSAPSAFAKDLFDIGVETARVLRDQLNDQVKAREALDLRKAAWQGIENVLIDTGKSTAIAVFDEGTRALIERLPDDQRFGLDVGYNTFLSPKTRVLTPWLVYKNLGAYWHEMVGKNLNWFWGAKISDPDDQQ